jgi:hypothetical protein
MKLRRALIVVLSLLLLQAQHATFAHVVSHAGDKVPAKEQLAHSKLCGKCVNFEKLSNALPITDAALLSLAVSHARPATPAYHHDPRTFVGFLSRAPPVLL